MKPHEALERSMALSKANNDADNIIRTDYMKMPESLDWAYDEAISEIPKSIISLQDPSHLENLTNFKDLEDGINVELVGEIWELYEDNEKKRKSKNMIKNIAEVNNNKEEEIKVSRKSERIKKNKILFDEKKTRKNKDGSQEVKLSLLDTKKDSQVSKEAPKSPSFPTPSNVQISSPKSAFQTMSPVKPSEPPTQSSTQCSKKVKKEEISSKISNFAEPSKESEFDREMKRGNF